MSIFYKRLSELCEERMISGYKMCKDNGIQPSIMTDLKIGRRSGVNAETASKLANYFNVSVDYLLGNSDEKNKPTTNCDKLDEDDVKVALFDGDKEVPDEYVLTRVFFKNGGYLHFDDIVSFSKPNQKLSVTDQNQKDWKITLTDRHIENNTIDEYSPIGLWDYVFYVSVLILSIGKWICLFVKYTNKEKNYY